MFFLSGGKVSERVYKKVSQGLNDNKSFSKVGRKKVWKWLNHATLGKDHKRSYSSVGLMKVELKC